MATRKTTILMNLVAIYRGNVGAGYEFISHACIYVYLLGYMSTYIRAIGPAPLGPVMSTSGYMWTCMHILYSQECAQFS